MGRAEPDTNNEHPHKSSICKCFLNHTITTWSECLAFREGKARSRKAAFIEGSFTASSVVGESAVKLFVGRLKREKQEGRQSRSKQ